MTLYQSLTAAIAALGLSLGAASYTKAEEPKKNLEAAVSEDIKLLSCENMLHSFDIPSGEKTNFCFALDNNVTALISFSTSSCISREDPSKSFPSFWYLYLFEPSKKEITHFCASYDYGSSDKKHASGYSLAFVDVFTDAIPYSCQELAFNNESQNKPFRRDSLLYKARTANALDLHEPEVHAQAEQKFCKYLAEALNQHKQGMHPKKESELLE